jgi:glutaconyl-CoA/methylmalonyl-CoA decarboxylase subunit gamma
MVVKKLCINGTERTFTLNVVSGGLDIVVTGEQGQMEKFFVTDYQYDQQLGIVYFQIDGRAYQLSVINISDEAGLPLLRMLFAGIRPITVQAKSLNEAKPSPLVRPATLALTIKSPIAGRIIKILVAPGELVREGQVLVMIESMKMENEICAPRAAFIKTIFIQQGNVVQPNQLLIDFEKEGESNAATKNEYEQKAI